MAEFRKVYTIQGFDREATPRWQMIPMSSSRYVVLRDGAGLTVTSTNPAVAKVEEITKNDVPIGSFDKAFGATDRFLQLDGVGCGIARIQAKTAAGATAVELEVDTKHPRTVRVRFNFVRDNAGHQTRRVPASVAQWVIDLNRFIFKAQANVEIVSHAEPRWVDVAQDLGGVVRVSADLPAVAASHHEWDAVVAGGDPTADLNIFLVWRFELAGKPSGDSYGGGTSGSDMLLEDRLQGRLHRNLGHELGHALGLDDHYEKAHKHDLMYGYEDGGTNLPKAHVNTITRR